MNDKNKIRRDPVRRYGNVQPSESKIPEHSKYTEHQCNPFYVFGYIIKRLKSLRFEKYTRGLHLWQGAFDSFHALCYDATKTM
jgi:hypothetical protein